MKFNRFFSFGCSWTKWFWPTWADIIAKDLDIEYQNWGSAGSGNQGIQSRFVEANNKFKFNENDLIIVQWSGWNREDRHLNGWKFGGNVFNNPYYDRKFIKKYWSYDNDLIKNSVIIKTTCDAYTHLISYQYSFDMPLSQVNVNNDDYNIWLTKDYTTDKTSSVIESYYKHLPNIEIPKFGNSQFNARCIDSHPDVMAHLEIVEKYIYPKVFQSTLVNDTTRQFFTSYYDDMVNSLSPTDKWKDMEDKANLLNKKYNLNLGEWYGV